MALAANLMFHRGLCQKILIIDLDVHQGNGTAKLFQNNPSVFTFSMYGGSNYPFHKEKSDLDIELANGTSSETYLTLLKEHLPKVLNLFEPEFAFYLAGIDILDTDKYGKLQVSLAACKKRDAFEFNSLKARQIPVTVALGGGYSPDIKVIVEAHCNTFRLAVDLFD